MSVYTRPAQIIAKTTKRIQLQRMSMLELHTYLVREGARDHAVTTSGGVSTRQLRSMGHPFGRQNPGDPSTGVRGIVRKRPSTISRKNRIRKGVLLPLPINRQTGRLRGSFFQTVQTGPNRVVDMGFNVPYAKFVLSPTGTKRMVARGYYSVGNVLGIIAKRHKSRVQGAVAAARKKALIP